MGTCSNCGTTILFGGVRDGERLYCRESCRQKQMPLIDAIRQIPDDLVERQVQNLHQGTCPKCGGPGPVDYFTSHRIWSLFVLTSWNSVPEICCRGCAVNAKLYSMLFSGALGWWGLPWGILITPIQLFRNLTGLISSPDPLRPSAELTNYVRTVMAARLLQSQDVPVAEAMDEPDTGTDSGRPPIS
jgi:hypothetical protein